MNKETFCSLPFTEIFLYPDGDIRPCCSAMDFFGNLHTDNINDIVQSKTAQEVRQSIIDGKWHPLCNQCKRQESQGARSERSGDFNKLQKEVGTLTASTFVLKRLDLRWSNTCNLSCTYCYEGFSSKWASIKGISVNTIKEENENSLFELIEKNKDTIETVMLLGGEPFLQRQNLRLIDMLPNKSFYTLTNLSVPVKTNKVAQKLLELDTSNFGVSFETVADKFEYVRRGASWEVFTDNVKYFNELNKPLESHSLYSIYSAFNLTEFYDYITENNFRHVFWNLLESAGENSKASVFNLPRPLKESAIRELDRCIKKYFNAPGIAELKNFRQNLINQLDNPNTKTEYHLKEIESIETLQPYNKKFADLWPKLYKGLTKC